MEEWEKKMCLYENWEKIKILGKGSFGVVFLLKMKKPPSCLGDQYVAVKVGECPHLASSLFNETHVLKHFVGCPEIIQSIGNEISFEGNKVFYNLILEYASGGTLLDFIRKRNKLSEIESKPYLTMILRGLSSIHRKGFVHSDLKPNNILVFPQTDGTIKLKITDFGLALKYDRDRSEEVKRLAKLCFRGMALYMSPESVAYGQIRPPLDIWSLGCIFVNMITGQRTWRDCEDYDELISKLVYENETPEIPDDELSQLGKDFLRRCFERNPKQRWTADMLLQHPFIQDF